MKPLDGIKIVDFTQAHAGSLATMLLADMGAEVIKIERLGIGDLARYWEPIKDENSGYYAYLNRGKKSISINASSKDGKEIINRLIKDADVVTENFKYGSMERMGFSYEEVCSINTNIIYASLNGFGQSGVMKNAIGLDLQLQSMSGAMDGTGFKYERPIKIGAAFGDHASGNYMVLGILSALVEKKKTGKGRKIDIAILDSVFSLMPEKVFEYSIGNKEQGRNGNASNDFCICDIFKVSDGYVYIEIRNDKQWHDFYMAVNQEDFMNIDELSNNYGRLMAYNNGLKTKLEELMKNYTVKKIVDLLNSNAIPCVKVNSVDEAMDSEITKANKMLVQINDTALSSIIIPQSSYNFKNMNTKILNPAPLQGQDTIEYIKQLGYNQYEIDTLIENKIIQTI